jgi:hypothetical protein
MDDPRPINALSSSSLSEEPLADYLKRRERELVQQTAAIRGLLAPKEKQLEEIRQAMKAIGIKPSYVEQLMPFLDLAGDSRPMHGVLNSPQTTPINGILNAAPFPWEPGNPLAQLVEPLTIKEMILHALNDHFHQGATPSELRDYMRTAYSRDVDRNSISPQLARLREEGLVQNTNALSGKWELALRGTVAAAADEIEKRNLNALDSSPKVPPPGTFKRRF